MPIWACTKAIKKLIWLSDSRSNVKAFPAGVQDDIGYALYAAQLGEMSIRAKPLHGLGSGVMEISANDESGTFRAVYTVSIGDSIYDIHAFQRNSRLELRHCRPRWSSFVNGSNRYATR
jgi:phage-related protein